jgi:hypothetical protein
MKWRESRGRRGDGARGRGDEWLIWIVRGNSVISYEEVTENLDDQYENLLAQIVAIIQSPEKWFM